MENRNEELQKQNTLLHEQIQLISHKMAENLQQASSENPMNISLTEEGKSHEQILEILGYGTIVHLFYSRTPREHIIKEFFIPACILTFVRVVPFPNLFSLPRFVRREKEIAESRFEVAQGESLRYRLRVEHLERELKEVQDSLSATKERMQVCFVFHFIVIVISRAKHGASCHKPNG